MNIQFNGKNVTTDMQLLADFLQEQGFATDSHVATAVNGIFVAKTARQNYTINDGDSVEVVAPMQGG